MVAGRTRYAIDALAHRRALRRWERATNVAPRADLLSLRRLDHQAGELRRRLDRFSQAVDERLSRQGAVVAPAGSDWTWRPAQWRGAIAPSGIAAAESRSRLGDGLTLFHDCPTRQIVMRQMRHDDIDAPAAYAVRLEVFGFDGAFLSLVLDMPRTAIAETTERHVVRAALVTRAERPLTATVRLNVRYGPNTAQMTEHVAIGDLGEAVAEFDLAYSEIGSATPEQGWIDIIFADPAMTRVDILDLTLSRRPRAEL